jgi:hypothetical protein
LLFGDHDEFTSYQKYERWCKTLVEEGKANESDNTRERFRSVCIEGESHFWRGGEMLEAIERWLAECFP